MVIETADNIEAISKASIELVEVIHSEESHRKPNQVQMTEFEGQ